MLRILRISRLVLGVVPQRTISQKTSRLVVDCSCFDLNRETALKLAVKEAMQFGKALERIVAQIVAARSQGSENMSYLVSWEKMKSWAFSF